MTKPKPKTHLGIVLDESGSMTSCRQATISGYNEYLMSLRAQKDAGPISGTLTMFNTVFTRIFTGLKLKDIPPLTIEDYIPGGMTALYDAIAHTLIDLDAIVRDIDRALCVIVTDGEENSSKEYTREQIFKMIQEREARGNWTFVYIGANQDAFAVGVSMGINVANTINYDTTRTEETFRGLAEATTRYSRSTVRQSKGFWNQSDFQDQK